MRSFALALLTAGLFVACNADKTTVPTEVAPPAPADPSTGAATATDPAAPVVTPTPGTPGKLTKAQLEQAKSQIKPFQPFNEAGPKLFALVGPPQGKDGDTIYWQADDAGNCFKLTVVERAGAVGTVGLASTPGACR